MNDLNKQLNKAYYEEESSKLNFKDYLISFIIVLIVLIVLAYKSLNLISQEKDTLSGNINSNIIINNKETIGEYSYQALGNSSEARDVISEVHSFLNSIVGWDSSPDIKEYIRCNEMSNLVLGKSKIVDYEPLRRDLNELVRNLKIGAERQDETYIIKAHRIAHDLDYHFYNENLSDTVFGVTETLKDTSIKK
ncbi:hypothetical protein GOM49_17955 [Clostridium bovifaecis]|uniref:Uncharacterized protein n=1 Tax=Clostridium bovifaecis TaxID=2184719 RepID=A0A6I6ESV9_9CLOT|nr:hypothetical protein GOM49_17955 [Clostridium bovifaecis]